MRPLRAAAPPAAKANQKLPEPPESPEPPEPLASGVEVTKEAPIEEPEPEPEPEPVPVRRRQRGVPKRQVIKNVINNRGTDFEHIDTNRDGVIQDEECQPCSNLCNPKP